MVPSILSDIAALPGWNTPMLLFLAKATFILIAALIITIAMQRGSAGARHLVWLGTLGTLLIVPAVLPCAPPLRIAILPPQTAPPLNTSSAPAPRAALTPELQNLEQSEPTGTVTS